MYGDGHIHISSISLPYISRVSPLYISQVYGDGHAAALAATIHHALSLVSPIYLRYISRCELTTASMPSFF